MHSLAGGRVQLGELAFQLGGGQRLDPDGPWNRLPACRVGLNPKLIGVFSSLIVLGVGLSAARTEAAE